MKFIPNEDYRDKIARIKRLAAKVHARNNPHSFTPLTDEVREQIEGVTRFEKFRGVVLKQNWRRPRVR
jgi:hypothetical protein